MSRSRGARHPDFATNQHNTDLPMLKRKARAATSLRASLVDYRLMVRIGSDDRPHTHLVSDMGDGTSGPDSVDQEPTVMNGQPGVGM